MKSTQVNWKAYAITSFVLANFPRQYPWEFMVGFILLGSDKNYYSYFKRQIIFDDDVLFSLSSG
jgi:hypothetical protein